MEVFVGEEEPEIDSSEYVKSNNKGDNSNSSEHSLFRSDDDGFYKKNQVKIVGLSNPDGRFPNGSKINLVEDKGKRTLFVESSKGVKKQYVIQHYTGIITRDGKRCDIEECRMVVKILNYMRKYMNRQNSKTITIG